MKDFSFIFGLDKLKKYLYPKLIQQKTTLLIFNRLNFKNEIQKVK